MGSTKSVQNTVESNQNDLDNKVIEKSNSEGTDIRYEQSVKHTPAYIALVDNSSWQNDVDVIIKLINGYIATKISHEFLSKFPDSLVNLITFDFIFIDTCTSAEPDVRVEKNTYLCRTDINDNGWKLSSITKQICGYIGSEIAMDFRSEVLPDIVNSIAVYLLTDTSKGIRYNLEKSISSGCHNWIFKVDYVSNIGAKVTGPRFFIGIFSNNDKLNYFEDIYGGINWKIEMILNLNDNTLTFIVKDFWDNIIEDYCKTLKIEKSKYKACVVFTQKGSRISIQK